MRCRASFRHHQDGGEKPQGKSSRDGSLCPRLQHAPRLKLQITGSLFPFPHSLVACRVEAGGKNPKPFKMTQMLRLETQAPATRRQKSADFTPFRELVFPLNRAGGVTRLTAGLPPSSPPGSGTRYPRPHRVWLYFFRGGQ